MITKVIGSNRGLNFMQAQPAGFIAFCLCCLKIHWESIGWEFTKKLWINFMIKQVKAQAFRAHVSVKPSLKVLN